MPNKRIWLTGGAIGLLLATGIGIGLLIAEQRPAPTPQPPAVTERKILYYKNPMGSGHVSTTPMQDEMGMDYIPVYSEPAAAKMLTPDVVTISPRTAQNIGLRTAPVSMGSLKSEVALNGALTIDETRVAVVTNKVEGYIEKLYINAVGQTVHSGAPIYDIYSPALMAMIEELHAAVRYQQSLPPTAPQMVQSNAAELIAAAHNRLQSMGLQRPQVVQLQALREVPRVMTIHASAQGIVLKKNITEGTFAPAATELFTLGDLSTLWIIAPVYEQELGKIRLGQTAAVTLTAFHGRVFHAKVDFIYPTLDELNRTAKVRFKIANAERVLRPGMIAKLLLATGTQQKQLLVPREAVLRSGNRDLVILSLGEGRFKPQPISVAGTDSEHYAISQGLKSGDTVVTSAQFLLDSESNLQTVVSQLTDGGAKNNLIAPASPASAQPAPPPNAPKHSAP